jgi:hypothetical protein
MGMAIRARDFAPDDFVDALATHVAELLAVADPQHAPRQRPVVPRGTPRKISIDEIRRRSQ